MQTSTRISESELQAILAEHFKARGCKLSRISIGRDPPRELNDYPRGYVTCTIELPEQGQVRQ